MQHTTNPFSYDFNKSYYENFYFDRYNAMATNGDYYDFFERLYSPNDSTKSVPGLNFGPAVVVNTGVEIADYVHHHYDGKSPECLTDKLVNVIEDAIEDIAYELANLEDAVLETLSELADIFGSFVCTATVEMLDDGKAQPFLAKLRAYRQDIAMSGKDGMDMSRYYAALGPKVVEAIEGDVDRRTMYQYLWAYHILPLSKVDSDCGRMEFIGKYFRMMDIMVKHYDIKVSERFNTWVTHTSEAIK